MSKFSATVPGFIFRALPISKVNWEVSMFTKVVDGILRDAKVTSLKLFKPPLHSRIPIY
jgi:hypothetical protein